MMYYVSHEYGGNAQNVEKAKKITHDLQVADPDNLLRRYHQRVCAVKSSLPKW